MKVNDIVYGMQTVQIRMPHGVICYQANTGLHPTGGRLLQLYREAITTIADALNAPVLATDAVLAGLPKDAKLMVVLDHKRRLAEHELFNEYGIWSFSQLGSENVLNYDRVHKIRANGCSKTAEYLRQFTLQGVRRVG
jgi:hypothetical protein